MGKVMWEKTLMALTCVLSSWPDARPESLLQGPEFESQPKLLKSIENPFNCASE